MNPVVEQLSHHIGKEVTTSPSPYMNWLRPVLLSVQEGSMSCSYVVRKEWTNPMGTLHGGVSASIVDDIIGGAIHSLNSPTFHTTLNLVVDYFYPAREGDTVVAEATIIKKGRQIVNVQCEIWHQDRSRMIARGTSNLLNTELKKML